MGAASSVEQNCPVLLKLNLVFGEVVVKWSIFKEV
jgi:hypothetical protein